MSRRLAAAVALLLAVPALALAADTDPKRQINPTDQAKAASLVLKRTDFAAGWKKVPNAPDSDTTCPGYAPNESDLVLTGEAESSFDASQALLSVVSFSSVYKTRANAVASWTRAVKPALARCAALLFKQGIEEEGGTVKIVKQGAVAFPKLAPRTAAFRVSVKWTVMRAGETTVIPFTIDLVALGRGRGDTGLMVIGPGTGIPAAELRGFARLLASRLTAARL